MKKHFPNLITSLNLASGFVAILYTANDDLITASWLIIAAMIFDFFDGFSARLLKVYSEIGKELDSLADVVSFGVAPAFIIYKMLVFSIGLDSNPGGWLSYLVLIIPAVMPVCAALRLAKFNIDPSQATSFKGLPTPANALAVVSIIIAQNFSDSTVFLHLNSSPLALVLLTITLSFLMVSNLPLMSLKVKNLALKGNEGRYILVLLAGLSLIFFGLSAATLVIPIYIIASLLSLFF